MEYAYDQLYLGHARMCLARMCDFVVYDLHQDLAEFFSLFIHSGEAYLFEIGDIRTLVGQSGIEMAYDVLDRCHFPYKRVKPRFTANRSEEYWTGWALAYYQWKSNLSFSEITRFVPIHEIKRMYYPYHEMDIRQFVDAMDEKIRNARPQASKRYRRILAAALSCRPEDLLEKI